MKPPSSSIYGSQQHVVSYSCDTDLQFRPRSHFEYFIPLQTTQYSAAAETRPESICHQNDAKIRVSSLNEAMTLEKVDMLLLNKWHSVPIYLGRSTFKLYTS